MIYEQRIYSCIPGRLPALLKRFETQTLPIWKKHGIRPVGFWTVLVGDGNHDLHYLLAWELLAEREKIWNAFQADPAWHIRPRRQREGRADPRQHQERVPAADGILGDQVTASPMARGIDHVVHAVHDLDAAAALYRALGFQVGARNRTRRPGARRTISSSSPAASSNCCRRRARRDRSAWPAVLFVRSVQSRLPGARRGALDAGAGRARRRSRRASVPRSRDRRFRAVRFRARRQAPRRHADQGRVLARLCERSGRAGRSASSPASIAIPENFWNPAFQVHPNTAASVAGVVLVAEKPSRPLSIFLTAFTGAGEVAASTSGSA